MSITFGELPDFTQNQLIKAALRIASIERYVFGRAASNGDYHRFNKTRARACSQALGLPVANTSEGFRQSLDDLGGEDEHEIVVLGMVLLDLGRRLDLSKEDLDRVAMTVKRNEPRPQLHLVKGSRGKGE